VRLIILKNLYYARFCDKHCSGDLAAIMNHLHIKRIKLVGFVYIVTNDTFSIVFLNYFSMEKFDRGETIFLNFQNYFLMEKYDVA
jgi:hypothetical protein